jgi:hypothetical protein
MQLNVKAFALASGALCELGLAVITLVAAGRGALLLKTARFSRAASTSRVRRLRNRRPFRLRYPRPRVQARSSLRRDRGPKTTSQDADRVPAAPYYCK